MKGMSGVLLAAVAVLGLAACEDGPVTLTEAEAKSLFVSLAKTPQGDPVSESADKNVYGCPDGGTVTVTGTGSIDEKGDTSTIRLQQVLVPEGCGANDLVLDGDPAVTYATNTTFVGNIGDATMDGGAKGSLKWRKGEDEGTCDIDLTLAAEEKLTRGIPVLEGAFKGKLCGHEVEIAAAEVIRIGLD